MQYLSASCLFLLLAAAGYGQTIDHHAASPPPAPASQSVVINGITYTAKAYFDPSSTWMSGDQFGFDAILQGCLQADKLWNGDPAHYGGPQTYINIAVGMNGKLQVGTYKICALNFPSFTQGIVQPLTWPGQLSSNQMGLEWGMGYSPGDTDVDSNLNPVRGQTHWLVLAGTTSLNEIPANEKATGSYFQAVPPSGFAGWYFWIYGAQPWGTWNPPFNGGPSLFMDDNQIWANRFTRFDMIAIPSVPYSEACVSNIFIVFIGWYEDASGNVTLSPTDNIKIMQYGEAFGYTVSKQ